MSSAAEKKILLRSSDGVVFEIDDAVAKESQIIKHMIEDDCAGDVIQIPEVTSKILSMVIEYSKKHAAAVVAASDSDSDSDPDPDSAVEEDPLKAWDAKFVEVDNATLVGLIQAANYLDMKALLDLTCQRVADKIKNSRNTLEIRQRLNMKSDFTAEEQQELYYDIHWSFE